MPDMEGVPTAMLLGVSQAGGPPRSATSEARALLRRSMLDSSANLRPEAIGHHVPLRQNPPADSPGSPPMEQLPIRLNAGSSTIR